MILDITLNPIRRPESPVCFTGFFLKLNSDFIQSSLAYRVTAAKPPASTLHKLMSHVRMYMDKL